MEKAVFGMDTLNVTQGMNNNFSHKGVLAIDIAGKDSGIESFKAPFTGVIKRKYPTDNEIWLESVDKVKYADGTEDYMTILLMHDNNTSDLKVGQVIKQGQVFYQEGTKGYATGNHIHLACGKGKFSGTGWYKNSSGQWCINNQYAVNKALFILNSCKIKNSGGYNWTKTNSYTYTKDVDYTGVITYRVYANGKWLPEVNKCDNTDNGYAGIYGKSISGFRCKPKYGEIIYEAHQLGGKWLGAVNSKDYSKNNGSSYAGIYNKPIDGIRIKSTKGYVDYRVHIKGGKWLDWARGFGDSGNSYAGIYGKEIDGIQMK